MLEGGWNLTIGMPMPCMKEFFFFKYFWWEIVQGGLWGTPCDYKNGAINFFYVDKIYLDST